MCAHLLAVKGAFAISKRSSALNGDFILLTRIRGGCLWLLAVIAFGTNAQVSPPDIAFGPVPAVIDTNTSFDVTLTARNADGSVATNFNQEVTLTAVGLEGPLPLVPTNSEPFVNGQGYAYIRVATPFNCERRDMAGKATVLR